MFVPRKVIRDNPQEFITRYSINDYTIKLSFMFVTVTRLSGVQLSLYSYSTCKRLTKLSRSDLFYDHLNDFRPHLQI